MQITTKTRRVDIHIEDLHDYNTQILKALTIDVLVFHIPFSRLVIEPKVKEIIESIRPKKSIIICQFGGTYGVLMLDEWHKSDSPYH
jgi:hypothetical protein